MAKLRFGRKMWVGREACLLGNLGVLINANRGLENFVCLKCRGDIILRKTLTRGTTQRFYCLQMNTPNSMRENGRKFECSGFFP